MGLLFYFAIFIGFSKNINSCAAKASNYRMTTVRLIFRLSFFSCISCFAGYIRTMHISCVYVACIQWHYIHTECRNDNRVVSVWLTFVSWILAAARTDGKHNQLHLTSTFKFSRIWLLNQLNLNCEFRTWMLFFLLLFVFLAHWIRLCGSE